MIHTVFWDLIQYWDNSYLTMTMNLRSVIFMYIHYISFYTTICFSCIVFPTHLSPFFISPPSCTPARPWLPSRGFPPHWIFWKSMAVIWPIPTDQSTGGQSSTTTQCSGPPSMLFRWQLDTAGFTWPTNLCSFPHSWMCCVTLRWGIFTSESISHRGMLHNQWLFLLLYDA